jgi:hypothetical protein
MKMHNKMCLLISMLYSKINIDINILIFSNQVFHVLGVVGEESCACCDALVGSFWKVSPQK